MMKENRVLKAFQAGWQRLLPILLIAPFLAWLQSYFKLSFSDLLMILAVSGVGGLFYLLIVAGSHLATIESMIEEGFHGLDAKLSKENLRPTSNPSNSNDCPPDQMEPSKREPEKKPSGGGAFAGMVVGGALGAAGGPIGVIIGGVLGALIGNQVEYENLRGKRQK